MVAETSSAYDNEYMYLTGPSIHIALWGVSVRLDPLCMFSTMVHLVIPVKADVYC